MYVCKTGRLNLLNMIDILRGLKDTAAENNEVEETSRTEQWNETLYEACLKIELYRSMY